MRADARRNRERLLAAATEAFAEHGADASLDDIARRAGTGIATLYRRFPDREALMRAVVLDALRRTADAARRAAEARVGAVQRIRLEVSLRDNASVVYGDPRSIRFGTIFVASLKSDEGMISVMAHELTHAADGARGTLAPLFRRVARRAEAEAGLRQVSARRAEELTCDLVGVLAARLYIARNDSEEPLARRAARAVEHNCVEQDETDAAHLSPRQTLNALLSLDQTLAGEVTGGIESETIAAPLNHTEPRASHAPPRAARRRAP
jgi:AcrR family transcriptional regulator